jgi:hypothetical protein
VFLFELWALILADAGANVSRIADLRRTTPFASLIKTELSQRLGGSCDTTRPRTPIGHYWRDLYELRVRVVHAGYLPHDGDAEKAARAYEGLEAFLREAPDPSQALSKRHRGSAPTRRSDRPDLNRDGDAYRCACTTSNHPIGCRPGVRFVAVGIAGAGRVGTIALRNTIVARLARFGGAAPLSLGDSESQPSWPLAAVRLLLWARRC